MDKKKNVKYSMHIYLVVKLDLSLFDISRNSNAGKKVKQYIRVGK